MELEVFDDHFRRAFPECLGSTVLVALSGGADSTALVHLLQRADLGLRIVAAHVHHGVRGDEADCDARFSEDLCHTLNLPFTMIRLDHSASMDLGREASWRRQRYAALKNAANEIGASAIATAHHRDDVAEGVLLQILRGAGPRAMAGIYSRDGKIIRPLLPFAGAEIRKWLVGQDLKWHEDSSNSSPEHLRNRVRHEVLPLIEGIAPRIRTHLVRLAQALADGEGFMAQELEKRDLWIDPWHPNGSVPAISIAALPQALQIRWLHAQVARVGLPRATHRQGELLSQVLSGSTTALTLAERWTLRHVGGRLWLDPGRSAPAYSFDLKEGETDLPIPGWHITLRDFSPSDTPGQWLFPLSAQVQPKIRCVRPGDRFDGGRRAAAALRNFLPRHLRRIWPILFVGDKLLWIPGVAAHTAKEGETRIVEVTHK